MSYLTKNIIPGDFGKVFSTNAKNKKDLLKIKKALLKLPGIKDIHINLKVFPVEITIHTESVVSVETVENEVKRFGFHASPKGVFQV
ncbi:MAG: heavy-metal-associated domain-containing protein [Flavobacteriaceae bacterium]|nr:heavy-metal-associated domain-containing protein [Flavobacteriaceae bacterium]